MTPRCGSTFVALWLALAAVHTAEERSGAGQRGPASGATIVSGVGAPTARTLRGGVAEQGSPRVRNVQAQHLHRYEASRMSMACVYAIEAYGPDAEALPRIADEAFDEVDRIDRLMSHYKADSALSRINREAARRPVTVEPELFDFIADAMRYHRDSDGAFDITVSPLMKAWGFFRGEGRVPADDELAAARRHVGGSHVILNPLERTVAFDRAGVELDLGGIAKGYAVDRVVHLLKQRQIAAALISAGGSTIYGLGAPPGRDAWDVAIQDPIDPRKTALTVQLKDRALSVAGSSEKWFEAGGARYSHIMDPRIGRPAQGVLSVAVLANSGTAGDALDNAFFVLGAEGSRACLNRLPGTEVFFFLPVSDRFGGSDVRGFEVRRLKSRNLRASARGSGGCAKSLFRCCSENHCANLEIV